MEKYCYYIDEKTKDLKIIPLTILQAMRNEDMMSIESRRRIAVSENNTEVEENIREEGKRAIQQYGEVEKLTQIPEGNFNTISVFSSCLTDNEFLQVHSGLLSQKKLRVILNDHEMDYYSRKPESVVGGSSSIIGIAEASLSDSFTMQEHALEKREEEELLNLYQQIDFKSVRFMESFDGEKSFTFGQLDNARLKISQIVKTINAYKNLSPYEKFYVAFMYASSFQYKKEDEKQYVETSRALISVLNGNEIVCAGKANVLKAVCDEIGIPCIYRTCERHAICSVAINDPKYSIYGIQTVDPTNQKTPILLNERNPIYKKLLGVDIDWIRKLTEEQRNFLMEKSGLSKLPESILSVSAQEFAERDQLIHGEFPSKFEATGFLEYKRNSFYGKTLDVLKRAATIMENKLDGLDFWQTKQNLFSIAHEVFQTSKGEIDAFGETDNIRDILSFTNWLLYLSQISTEEELNDTINEEFYSEVKAQLEEWGIPLKPEALKEFFPELCKEVLEEIKKEIVNIQEKIDGIDKITLSMEIQVGEGVKNIGKAAAIMAQAHQEEEMKRAEAIVYGALIDGERTSTHSPELQEQNREFWAGEIQKLGYDPESVVPTHENMEFNPVVAPEKPLLQE